MKGGIKGGFVKDEIFSKDNPQEIYIKSPDNNRTIESIYSFIQGLYSNSTGQKINENVVPNTNITYPPNKNFWYKICIYSSKSFNK